MNYWLNLYNGNTWQEFLNAGASITAFRTNAKAAVEKINVGDILICYMAGVQRFVGAVEVLGPTARSKVFSSPEFALHLSVKPMLTLKPEHGVPLDELLGQVEFFESEADKGTYKGFLRRNPTAFRSDEDARLILYKLSKANVDPVFRKIAARKIAHRPYYEVERGSGGEKSESIVTIPEAEILRTDEPALAEAERVEFGHTEIQWRLLTFGAQMGLDVWVARNDRSRVWKDQKLGELPRMLQSLPTQFNAATQRTIELIDVLWLKGNTVVAAFEVECTTSVYSGLLRMSDLLALQPNLDINLYIVAPDERRDKVEQEILRPTFSLREKPLRSTCGFLSVSKMVETFDGARKLNLVSSLPATFLKNVAEYFEPTA